MNVRGKLRMVNAVAEVLEQRRFLSATAEVIDATLVVRGTDKKDLISIWGGETFFGVKMNGVHREFARRHIDRIEVYGGDGRDYLDFQLTHHPVMVFGGAGDDVIWGSDRMDTLVGGRGDDLFHAGAGDDVVRGEAGRDIVHGNQGADTVRGGAGDDFLDGDEHRDSLMGGADYDTIRSGEGDDDVVDAGPDGAHLLVSDYVEGGRTPGAATIELIDRVLEVRISGGELNLITTWFSRGIVSVQVNGAARDFDPDEVAALRMIGGTGKEEVTTWMPAPARIQVRFYGGDGDDRYRGGHISATVHGEAGNDYLFAGAGDHHLVGGTGNDMLYGHGGNDYIRGGDGSDSLNGGVGRLTYGNDTIYGGPGDDQIVGGEAADSLYGGSGMDVIYDGDEPWPAEVQYNTDDDRLEGGGGSDTLHAFGGNDTLVGGDGADEMLGGDGDDVLHRDDEDTVLDGGAGNDIILND